MSARATDNVDPETVRGFGQEWAAFDHGHGDTPELQKIFEEYFSEFPWTKLPEYPVGIDCGCGSGRWARYVAPKVGKLICVDASEEALGVARRNLAGQTNVELICSTVDAMPVPDGSVDFAYSLGVLHHIPDTARALAACTRKLKPGAPFLVYLYYSLDNRSRAFRAVWKASDLVRRGISAMPFRARHAVSEALAATVYFPLARGAAIAERMGADVSHVPLSAYRDKSFYTMRNDALDRFGTRLEQRFSRVQIEAMMRAAGLEDIRFREGTPYWCAVGIKAG